MSNRRLDTINEDIQVNGNNDCIQQIEQGLIKLDLDDEAVTSQKYKGYKPISATVRFSYFDVTIYKSNKKPKIANVVNSFLNENKAVLKVNDFLIEFFDTEWTFCVKSRVSFADNFEFSLLMKANHYENMDFIDVTSNFQLDELHSIEDFALRLRIRLTEILMSLYSQPPESLPPEIIERSPELLVPTLKGELWLDSPASVVLKDLMEKGFRRNKNMENAQNIYYYYFLIDPRESEQLINLAKDETESFQQLFQKKLLPKFIQSIFYIGLGKAKKVDDYLSDTENWAIKQKESENFIKNMKLLDILNSPKKLKYLIICFKDITREEVYTRQAAIIEFFTYNNSIVHLTNQKQGTYYGIVKQFFTDYQKKVLGLRLLTDACTMFLQGSCQNRDVSLAPKCKRKKKIKFLE